MTALKKYQRLESPGLWRPSSDEERIEVVVSVGNSSLVMYDYNDQAKSHWSLPALIRLNQNTRPAIYAPGLDSEEELEISDDAMIDAIEQVQKAIEPRGPRLRWLKRALLAGFFGALLVLGIIWLPKLLINHAASIVPDTKRIELGERLLTHVESASDQQCHTAAGTAALSRLHDRLLGNRSGRLVILPNGIAQSNHLPGGLILLHPSLIEDYESPDVLAGYVIAEAARTDIRDPVVRLLEQAGLIAALRLLATGDIAEDVLFAQAGALLSQPTTPVERDVLLERFRQARISTTPYAVAASESDESTLSLIDANPGSDSPALSDIDWVRLQRICGG